MIPCYCTNMIGNKRNPFIAPKFLVVLHFYDNTLHILLVNVNYFTFYHSNDGSVGIPIPDNIEIDTSLIFLCQLLMKINLFKMFTLRLVAILDLVILWTPGEKLSLALYLKSLSTSLTSTMQILVLLPPNPQSILYLPHIRLTITEIGERKENRIS